MDRDGVSGPYQQQQNHQQEYDTTPVSRGDEKSGTLGSFSAHSVPQFPIYASPLRGEGENFPVPFSERRRRNNSEMGWCERHGAPVVDRCVPWPGAALCIASGCGNLRVGLV